LPGPSTSSDVHVAPLTGNHWAGCWNAEGMDPGPPGVQKVWRVAELRRDHVRLLPEDAKHPRVRIFTRPPSCPLPATDDRPSWVLFAESACRLGPQLVLEKLPVRGPVPLEGDAVNPTFWMTPPSHSSAKFSTASRRVGERPWRGRPSPPKSTRNR